MPATTTLVKIPEIRSDDGQTVLRAESEVPVELTPARQDRVVITPAYTAIKVVRAARKGKRQSHAALTRDVLVSEATYRELLEC